MIHKITLKLAFLLLLFVATTTATIRYVSHFGSSTPPYTTWETAADSIQKCIDYSVAGDTIIVANEVYYESLIINKYLWLIGSSMDSTVVDGTGLADYTVEIQSDSYIKNFWIKGKGEVQPNTIGVAIVEVNALIEHCKITNTDRGIVTGLSSSIVDQCIISNVRVGYDTSCPNDTCHPIIKNSIIYVGNPSLPYTGGIKVGSGGNPMITGNIILGDNSTSSYGINVVWWAKTMTIKNNIISGFKVSNIDARFTTDTAIIQNNTATHQIDSDFESIHARYNSYIKNNIIAYNNGAGIRGDPSAPVTDYNLFWENGVNTGGGVTIDSTDVLGDPMFVNDTIPTYGGSYDYHLQMFSPAIDAGDPNILDVDGTRSDLGAYGGPGGSSYTYLNLPTKPPVNLTALVQDSTITLTWNKNSEADTAFYKVYRDTTANFTIDSTNFIGSTTDTIYIDPVPKQTLKLYYKVTCVDTKGNESEPSEEAVIILTVGMDEWKVINNYALYQNYPNPFNPRTRIDFSLAADSKVTLKVFNVLGEEVAALLNSEITSGIHYVNFDAAGINGGVYFYRIEAAGIDGSSFVNVKKMILTK